MIIAIVLTIMYILLVSLMKAAGKPTPTMPTIIHNENKAVLVPERPLRIIKTLANVFPYAGRLTLPHRR